MNKNIIAKKIVDSKFSELCNDVYQEYNLTSAPKFDKVKTILYKPLNLLMIIITAFCSFILLVSLLDLLYSVSGGAAALAAIFLTIAYLVLASAIAIILLYLQIELSDFTLIKYPSGKYNFTGLDKYLENEITFNKPIDELFKFGKKREENDKLYVKFYKNFKNGISLYRNRIRERVFVLLILIGIMTYITFAITTIDFTNDKYNLVLIYCILLLVLPLILCHILFIIYEVVISRKALMRLNQSGLEYSSIEIKHSYKCDDLYIKQKEESFSILNTSFLRKAFIMWYVSKNNKSYNFINSDNYVEYLGELAESIKFEITIFNEDFKYFVSSDRFENNELLKELLNLCVESLSKLPEQELIELNNGINIKMLEIQENPVVEETLNTYNRVTFKVATNTIINKGKMLYANGDEYLRNIYSDSRIVVNKLQINKLRIKVLSTLMTITKFIIFSRFKYLEKPCDETYNSYFNFQNINGKLLAFTGYSSSYFKCYLQDKLDSYNSFQFVLDGEDTLLKEGNIYISKVEPGNQLFYNHKLILSKEVVEVLKEYINKEEILVEYNQKQYQYYICTPKEYSKSVIIEEYSIYLEELSTYFIKESILVEPYLVKKIADDLKVFGIISKRVSKFEYDADYQYSYIFLVEKIYDHLKHFDDLHIIKNNRNDGRFLNAETPKINLKSKNTISIKFESKSSKLINNNKYTYTKERIKLYNKYNIKNLMMLLTYILMTVVIFILIFSVNDRIELSIKTV